MMPDNGTAALVQTTQNNIIHNSTVFHKIEKLEELRQPMHELNTRQQHRQSFQARFQPVAHMQSAVPGQGGLHRTADENE
eukprot:10966670-Karenia_brevis.AAC.1